MTLNEISIEITQQCPNRCIHCSSCSSWLTTQYIPFEVLKSVIEDAAALGARTICLSGGEPFLHPDIVKVVRLINSFGLSCSIYTSGIWSDGKSYHSIPLKLVRAVKHNNVKLIVNYEASDGKTYNVIMGTDFRGYRLMRNTIRKALKEGLIVETHVVPMPINSGHLARIVKQCNRLGVTRVSFLRIVMHGRALENSDLTKLNEKDIVSLRRSLRGLAHEDNLQIRLGIPFSDCTRRIICQTGISKLNIRYDGLVYPCEAFKNDLPVGFTKVRPDSIYERRLNDIYENSQYLKEIRERLEHFQSMQTCENCMNQYYRM